MKSIKIIILFAILCKMGIAQDAKGISKDSILKLVTRLNLEVEKLKDSGTKAPSTDSLNKSISVLKKDIDAAKNLKISGWIQAQYQYADTSGVKNFDGGDFPTGSDQRFMIRRGRIKFIYSQKNSQFVLQLNATERGVNLADIYAKYIDPWTHSIKLMAGIMNRPFGFEIQQSSSERETPERSRFIQTLLANERDLGVMLSFQPEKGKLLHGLKIDAGIYNGTGIGVPGTGSPIGSVNAPIGTTGTNGYTDFDKYKDLIGRIYYAKSTKNEKFSFGIGASHYNGGFAYQNNIVYNSISTNEIGNKIWTVIDTVNGESLKGKKAPRIYNSVDAQITIKTFMGTTTIRGEYITGKQAGKSNDNKSTQSAPNAGSGNYIRNFDGTYVYLIHRIGKSKHELAVRYDWFDPNTNISATDLNGLNGMKEGEIKYTSLGIGYNFYLDKNIKFMLYYNTVTNEVTKIKGYSRDLKDNILTIRMQYKF